MSTLGAPASARRLWDTRRVFLSYRLSDRPMVRDIDERLALLGLKVWRDESNIEGRPVSEGVDRRIEECLGAIVVFGMDDRAGSYQEDEIDRLTMRLREVDKEDAAMGTAERRFRLVPVLLPGVKHADIAPSLKRFPSVVWAPESADRSASEVFRAITGTEPNAPPELRSAPIAKPDWARFASDASGLPTMAYLVGPSCVPVGAARPHSQLTANLLEEIDPESTPFSFLDVASFLFEVANGDGVLQQRVDAALTADTCAASGLIADLVARRASMTTGRVRQAVVTTNTDLSIEVALVRRGLPFTRGVQREADATKRLVGLTIKRVPAPPFAGRGRPYSEVVEWLGTLPESTVPTEEDSRSLGPAAIKDVDLTADLLVYKLLGSQDLRGSTSITSEKLARWIGLQAEGARQPSGLKSFFVGDAPVLIVGFSPLDPEFRLVREALLYQKPGTGRRIFLYSPSDDSRGLGRTERALWLQLQEHVQQEGSGKWVTQPPSEFMAALAGEWANR